MTEAISKFQPNRCFALRGTDAFGAWASLCNATANSFNVYGVFREQGDFSVLPIWNADNAYEHYSIKYLPDFDVTNVSLSFDVQYNGLQPFDSSKFSWIGWAQIQAVLENGSTANIFLFDHATLASGTFVPASGVFTFSDPGFGDEAWILVNNVSFFYACSNFTDTKIDVAGYLANLINEHDWSTFFWADVAVLANVDGAGGLILEYGRTGTVNVSGTAVTWVSGTKFPGLQAGNLICLGASVANIPPNLEYTIATVNSPTSITLTASYTGSGSTGLSYCAPYGGVDGNNLTCYALLKPSNTSLSVSPLVLPLTGGTSYDAVWNISFSFADYSITALRQAWLTFAPALAIGTAYADTEWSVAVTNWTVTDPGVVTPLKCAGPGSVRIGAYRAWTSFAGSSWAAELSNNNTYLGRAKSTHGTKTSGGTITAGDSVTIKYSCNQSHELYLGTFLYIDRGILTVSLDGDGPTSFDCYLGELQPIPTRRKLRTGVAAGDHSVTLTLSDVNAAVPADPITGTRTFYFWFDYIEAAVLSDIPQLTQPYSRASPALDYDTDQTYKPSPARTIWALSRLGFTGDLNLYCGVFFWNQRIRGTNAVYGISSIDFSGTFVNIGTDADEITVNIGGVLYVKSIREHDTLATIAAHFAYYINSGSVGVWASTSGGTLTITARSTGATYVFNVTASKTHTATGSTGVVTVTANGTNTPGTDGDWIVNSGAANPINYPTRMFLADLYALCAAAGIQCVTSFSMELVNPPDWPTSPIGTPGIWSARFLNGDSVATSTDLSFNGALLKSTQCAPVTALTNFQKLVYATAAGLQDAAGLTPWLQFGEFLWWFFCQQDSTLSQQAVPIGFLSFTTPISVGTALPHNLNTGDRVIVSGVQGMTSANGTRPITVTDSTHYTLDGSVPNAAWVPGTGLWTGGSMAYYDSETAAAAVAALGRALAVFTCQDDDPSVNGGDDTAFLAARLKAHVDAIRTHVLGLYAGAKFELLYPDDVNHPTCIYNAAVPFPQGGRLNAAVNFPPDWGVPASSGLHRIKAESLSMGAQYRNLDLAKAAMTRFSTSPNSWASSDLAYLVPIFNGGCPWVQEFLAAIKAMNPSDVSLSRVYLWAFDHLCLMSWPLPLPVNEGFERSS